MGVNSLSKTVTRQRRDCDLNPDPSATESSTLTTRLSSHPKANKPLNMLINLSFSIDPLSSIYAFQKLSPFRIRQSSCASRESRQSLTPNPIHCPSMPTPTLPLGVCRVVPQMLWLGPSQYFCYVHVYACEAKKPCIRWGRGSKFLARRSTFEVSVPLKKHCKA